MLGNRFNTASIRNGFNFNEFTGEAVGIPIRHMAHTEIKTPKSGGLSDDSFLDDKTRGDLHMRHITVNINKMEIWDAERNRYGGILAKQPLPPCLKPKKSKIRALYDAARPKTFHGRYFEIKTQVGGCLGGWKRGYVQLGGGQLHGYSLLG